MVNYSHWIVKGTKTDLSRASCALVDKLKAVELLGIRLFARDDQAGQKSINSNIGELFIVRIFEFNLKKNK